MRAQVSEVVLLSQFARKLNLTLILLVPPALRAFLSLKLAFFVLVTTLTIIFTLFLIPSGLLVALLV